MRIVLAGSQIHLWEEVDLSGYDPVTGSSGVNLPLLRIVPSQIHLWEVIVEAKPAVSCVRHTTIYEEYPTNGRRCYVVRR